LKEETVKKVPEKQRSESECEKEEEEG